MMIHKYFIHKTALAVMLVLCFSPLTRAEYKFNTITSPFKIELKKDVKDFKLKGPVKTVEDSVNKLTFNRKGQLIRHEVNGLFEELIYDNNGNLLNDFLFVYGQYFESELTKKYAPQSELLKEIMDKEKKIDNKDVCVTVEKDDNSLNNRIPHWNIVQLVSYKYTTNQKVKELKVIPKDLMVKNSYEFIYEYDNNDSLAQYTILGNKDFLNAKKYTYKDNLLIADTVINIYKEVGVISTYEYYDNRKLKQKNTKHTSSLLSNDTVSYRYNPKGELIEHTTKIGNFTRTEKYTYTEQGKETIHLENDTIHEKELINNDNELVYRYIYNRKGEIWFSLTQTFDKWGNVIEQKSGFKGSDPTIDKCEYTYDSYGNITTMKVNGKVKERYRYTYYKPVKKGK